MTSHFERLKHAFSGGYRVQRELGRNGWIVYLAQDLKDDSEVALWVTVPSSSVGAERFLREMSRIAKLDHPHILLHVDSGHADEFLYYVLQHVECDSLRDRLRRDKQLPVDDALQITRQVAEALSYADSRGVVHGDIRPENILIPDGHALVAGFGWRSRALLVAGEPTELGIVVGTPAYMSPEQAMGAGDVGHRSEVYSLASVLYEMLTGNPPFVASDARGVLAKVKGEFPSPISQSRLDVPAAVEAALSCALAKLPADRFATVLKFAEALELDRTGRSL